MAQLYPRFLWPAAVNEHWRNLKSVLKKRYVLEHQARLDQRRIFIVPTRNGMIFGIMVLVMLVGSINYDNNLAFVLTFLLAGVGLVGILHTFKNIVGLSFDVGRVYSVYAESDARIQILVKNNEPYCRYNLQFSIGKSSPARVDLQPGINPVIVTIAAKPRGVHHVETLRVETEFPVGLFRAWSYVELNNRYLVYPKPQGETLQHTISHALGDDSAIAPGGNDDFLGFRRFQKGDSLRHIYWKAVARGREPLTKQFGQQESPELWFDWERIGHLPVEARLSQLCQWILDAENFGLPYGFRMPGVEIPPNRGDIHRLNCLKYLATYGIE